VQTVRVSPKCLSLHAEVTQTSAAQNRQVIWMELEPFFPF
jgi:hypothetical protein